MQYLRWELEEWEFLFLDGVRFHFFCCWVLRDLSVLGRLFDSHLALRERGRGQHTWTAVVSDDMFEAIMISSLCLRFIQMTPTRERPRISTNSRVGTGTYDSVKHLPYISASRRCIGPSVSQLMLIRKLDKVKGLDCALSFDCLGRSTR
jgi:hypothetical protein